MRKDEILVVTVNAFMHKDDLENLQRRILKQKESGVIVLQNFCTVQIAPKDIEIKVEEKTYGKSGRRDCGKH